MPMAMPCQMGWRALASCSTEKEAWLCVWFKGALSTNKLGSCNNRCHETVQSKSTISQTNHAMWSCPLKDIRKTRSRVKNQGTGQPRAWGRDEAEEEEEDDDDGALFVYALRSSSRRIVDRSRASPKLWRRVTCAHGRETRTSLRRRKRSPPHTPCSPRCFFFFFCRVG